MHNIKNRCPDIRLIKLDQNKSENTKTIIQDIKYVLACLGLYPIDEKISDYSCELTFPHKENKSKVLIKLTYSISNIETNFITIKAFYGKVPESKRSKILTLINLMNNTFILSRITLIPDTGEVELVSDIIFYEYFHTAELFLSMEYFLFTGKWYLDSSRVIISTNETPEAVIDCFKNGSAYEEEK